MNQFTGDRTRAIAAFCAVNALEKLRGEGVETSDVAKLLGVTSQTALKWLRFAERAGTVAKVKRHVMGAAWRNVYYGMFSASFSSMWTKNEPGAFLSEDQKDLLGLNG